MKKLAFVALLVPSMALATWSAVYPAPSTNQSMMETQALTRAAPTLASDGATAGVTLGNPQLPASQSGIAGVSVTVCAEATRTLAGAGTLQFYAYDNALPEWSRISDLDLPVTATGVRCQTFAGIWVNMARGRLLAAATGVTVSGGTTVTVYMMVR